MTGPDDDPLLSLPDELRAAFKEPFGPIYTDPETLLADVDADAPVIAVGDVVTHHLERAGYPPDVAVVDGRTKREPAPDQVRETVDARPDRIAVENPAATVTVDLLRALVDAIAAREPWTIVVDGEEDLAAVPAVIAAPLGATVVYGQPDEGMVAVAVTEEAKAEFRKLLRNFEGDSGRALAILDR